MQHANEKMTPQRLEAIKATFPWTTYVKPLGGIVQVIDRNGNEVPIFDMTDFLQVVTLKMTPKPAEPG